MCLRVTLHWSLRQSLSLLKNALLYRVLVCYQTGPYSQTPGSEHVVSSSYHNSWISYLCLSFTNMIVLKTVYRMSPEVWLVRTCTSLELVRPKGTRTYYTDFWAHLTYFRVRTRRSTSLVSVVRFQKKNKFVWRKYMVRTFPCKICLFVIWRITKTY